MTTRRPASAAQSALPTALDPPDHVATAKPGNRPVAASAAFSPSTISIGAAGARGDAIQAIQRARDGSRTPTPAQTPGFTPQGLRQDFLGPVWLVESANPMDQLARRVAIGPRCRRLPVAIVRGPRVRRIGRHRADPFALGLGLALLRSVSGTSPAGTWSPAAMDFETLAKGSSGLPFTPMEKPPSIRPAEWQLRAGASPPQRRQGSPDRRRCRQSQSPPSGRC